MVESSTLETGLWSPDGDAALRGRAAATLLSSVADPIRLGLLHRLAERGKSCVCTLQEEAGVAPNLLSYHLRVLREAGLVTVTRRGRWMDYELAPDALERLHTALPSAGKAAGDGS